MNFQNDQHMIYSKHPYQLYPALQQTEESETTYWHTIANIFQITTIKALVEYEQEFSVTWQSIKNVHV
jgi:hypothetical protein